MRRPALVGFALSIAALAACAKDKPGTDTSGATAAASTGTKAPEKVGETAGLKVPESVRYDADLDVYFISNINGNPSQKDNNGFIARVKADSVGAVTMLAEGGKNGLYLHAPKGMAIQGDTLFVADIDTVRMFHRETGAVLGARGVPGATFLK